MGKSPAIVTVAPPAPTDEPGTPPTKKAADPEIQAITRIAAALAPLSPAAAGRVLYYVTSRWASGVVPTDKPQPTASAETPREEEF